MKTLLNVLALALGLTFVGCDDSVYDERAEEVRDTTEQYADDVRDNYDTAADNLEDRGETIADNIEDAGERRADKLEEMDDDGVITEID